MIEQLNCPHGGGFIHLLYDIGWMAIVIVGSPVYLIFKRKLPKVRFKRQ